MAQYRVLAKDGVRYMATGRKWRCGAAIDENMLPPRMIEKMVEQGLVEQINRAPVEHGDELLNVPGVTQQIAAGLRAAGIDSPADLADATVEQLTQMRGIGRAMASKLLDAANALAEE